MFSLNLFALTQARLPLAMQAELILRIVTAAICGACVGIERGRRFKDAGIRTHCMVACSAAVMVIISKYGFTDLVDAAGNVFPGVRGADPARIAAQVVSGISFLGVGVIYRDRRNATKGLTTAAGIWAVAGIGMAIGAGLYVIGVFTTIFVLTLQIFMHKSFFLQDRYSVSQKLDFVAQDDGDTLDRLDALLEGRKIAVVENKVERAGNMIHCRYLLRMSSEQNTQAITSEMLKDPGVRTVDWSEPG